MSPAKQSYKTLSELPRKAACWGSGHSRGGSKELGAARIPRGICSTVLWQNPQAEGGSATAPEVCQGCWKGFERQGGKAQPLLAPCSPPSTAWLPETQRGRCSPKEALLQLLLLQNLRAGSAGCSLIRAFRQRRRRIKGSFSPRHDSLEYSLRHQNQAKREACR